MEAERVLNELQLVRREEQLPDFDTAVPVAVEKAMMALGEYSLCRRKYLWLDCQVPKDHTRIDQARTDMRQARLELQYSLCDVTVRIDSKF